jgi:hypothetical protein
MAEYRQVPTWLLKKGAALLGVELRITTAISTEAGTGNGDLFIFASMMTKCLTPDETSC